MSSFFNEATYEEAVIELFENIGYTHIHAPDMGRTDFSDPLLDSVLRDSLVKINKGLPYDAISEAIGKLRNFDSGSLVQKNVVFMNYLQNGVPVKYYDKGEERSVLVYLMNISVQHHIYMNRRYNRNSCKPLRNILNRGIQS